MNSLKYQIIVVKAIYGYPNKLTLQVMCVCVCEQNTVTITVYLGIIFSAFVWL
jgi:hypothetical protein